MTADPAQLALNQTVAEKDKETASKLEGRIAYSYSKPEWATLFGVRNAGGFDANRTADAISLGLWPSTCHELHGFEIKVSRGDWQRELKDPWKSEAFAKFCDRWWLVAAKADIVKPGELPEGWGLMIPHGSGVKRVHPAKGREKPAPLERGFMAAILKRATDTTPEEVRDAENHAREQARIMYAGVAERAEEREKAAGKAIEEFEAASGIHINTWSIKENVKIGEAVRFILNGGLGTYHRQLRSIDGQAARVREAIAALNLPEEPT